MVETADVATLLDRRAAEHPDRVMMVVDQTPVTFAQMRDRAGAAAATLVELGVQRGETVALFARTCPEWVYFWLGAAHIGAISAAVNVANKGEFLSHALRVARAKVVLTDAEHEPRVADIAADVDTLDTVVTLDGSPGAQRFSRPLDPPGADQVGVLFFTSGTTGPSKAVATTWRYLFSAADAVADAWQLAAGEVLWSAMPLFHLSAAPMVLTPLLLGSTTVLRASFHPGEVLDDIRSCGAAGFAGAGAMVSMLANQPADSADSDNPLRFISAAPIDAAMYRGIEQRYAVRVVTMYGLTEAFPIAYKGVREPGVPGASGRVNPAFEVWIVDADGRPVPAGVVGEICCRAMRPGVISDGYVRVDPAALRVEPHPEWFRTGDMGVLGADGQLSYVDRVKDSLRRRGENVSSVEVETTVMKHPAILEAAAVGVPSDLGEDDILVVVALRPGLTMDFADLLDFCSARMPYFCVPRYVEVVDELPKNAVGRVRKDLLRAKGLTPGAWDREAHGYEVVR
ncbi:AMP-binding protein [Mycolicibacterium flavescens]|uniref:ATP-dependent acyl-CoA ligase n=1 Tax=Mycolicibacterium flavescens TaxID=1776 RepID=A0A1E3RLV9_MYCFV|nr:AMP-binding protein [Mycolicibacterium flavescens]MCV7281776.1 AMP-binding protein [Mycolicibacterium flavescens]ODQ90834.1 ATP-dependent acyl-CoA ligase [Mycolicibacterium flavescens]